MRRHLLEGRLTQEDGLGCLVGSAPSFLGEGPGIPVPTDGAEITHGAIRAPTGARSTDRLEVTHADQVFHHLGHQVLAHTYASGQFALAVHAAIADGLEEPF
jgi:hypothetical protein